VTFFDKLLFIKILYFFKNLVIWSRKTAGGFQYTKAKQREMDKAEKVRMFLKTQKEYRFHFVTKPFGFPYFN